MQFPNCASPDPKVTQLVYVASNETDAAPISMRNRPKVATELRALAFSGDIDLFRDAVSPNRRRIVRVGRFLDAAGKFVGLRV